MQLVHVAEVTLTASVMLGNMCQTQIEYLKHLGIAFLQCPQLNVLLFWQGLCT